MKVRTLLGTDEELEQEQPVPEFCLPKCKIGLEYEWENTAKFPVKEEEDDGVLIGPNTPPYIKDVNKYFKTHVDGSLRKQGCEYVFRDGYRGSKILNAIAAMDDCSRGLGFTGSYRTSLHVHIDVAELEIPEDLELLGAVYCITEPFLYQFVGNNRNACNYCIPWYKHSQQFENFLQTIRAFKLEGLDSSLSRANLVHALRNGKGSKYSGLNCFSLGDFGTVEFRQAPVTMQKDKIITWINIIMRTKDWVLKNKMSIPKFVDYCNSKRVDWIMHDIFRTQYPDVMRLSRNPEADFWNGMETLYQYVSI